MKIVDITKLHALIQETSSVLAHDIKNHVLSVMSYSLFCKIHKGYLNSGIIQELYRQLPQDGVYFNLDVSEGFKKWYPSVTHEIAKRLTATPDPEITATILSELLKNENWEDPIYSAIKDKAQQLSKKRDNDCMYTVTFNQFYSLHRKIPTSRSVTDNEHADFLKLCKETKQSCDFLVPSLIHKLKDLMDLAEEISLLSNPEKVASVSPLSHEVFIGENSAAVEEKSLPEPVSSLKLKRG